MQIRIKTHSTALFAVYLLLFPIAAISARGADPYAKKVAQVASDAEKSMEESSGLSASSKKNVASGDFASVKTSDFATPPQFKNDEYALFLDDSYKIFKTKKFDRLELSEGCFKKAKPACLALEFSQIKPRKLELKAPGMNNMSAIHCEEVGGRNLLALDNKNNHYNFCRFNDGSMVNSWSMHYKHFPNKSVK